MSSPITRLGSTSDPNSRRVDARPVDLDQIDLLGGSSLATCDRGRGAVGRGGAGTGLGPVVIDAADQASLCSVIDVAECLQWPMALVHAPRQYTSGTQQSGQTR